MRTAMIAALYLAVGAVLDKNPDFGRDALASDVTLANAESADFPLDMLSLARPPSSSSSDSFAIDTHGIRRAWGDSAVFPPHPLDYDDDGDVDINDYNRFVECGSGPAIPLGAGCEGKDLDHDGDVDQEDFGIFQRCFSGSAITPNPACAG